VNTLLKFAAVVCIAVAVAACKAPATGNSYEDYPEFQEGGEITLTIDGTPRTIRLNDIVFANTDDGYPDYVEARGNNTRLVFECSKDHNLDFDTDSAYQPIISVGLPLENPGSGDEKFTIQIPNLDTFDVLGGSLTMEKYTIGRDGRDWWDGTLRLTLESADAPITVNGTFSWCIVPVW
jgi:hypothetical protein